MTTLPALHDLLAAATGPSRVIDVALATVFFPKPFGHWIDEDDPWCNDDGDEIAPEVTDSVDAALALIRQALPGVAVGLVVHDPLLAGAWFDKGKDVEAPTAPLALLRALVAERLRLADVIGDGGAERDRAGAVAPARIFDAAAERWVNGMAAVETTTAGEETPPDQDAATPGAAAGAKCDACRWCLLEDYGYSNYTVEGTYVHCLKELHPGSGFDRFYGDDSRLDVAASCPAFSPGEPVEVDVDREGVGWDAPLSSAYGHDAEVKALLDVWQSKN